LVSDIGWISITTIYPKIYDRLLISKNNLQKCINRLLLNQKEIDLVEEFDGKLYGYEIKWKKRKVNPPQAWGKHYPDADFEVIHRDNYLNFLQEIVKQKKA